MEDLKEQIQSKTILLVEDEPIIARARLKSR